MYYNTSVLISTFWYCEQSVKVREEEEPSEKSFN